MAAFVIGVTGGIGSGKSAVCREFEKRNIDVVDADIASRQVVEPGSDGLREIVEYFGQRVIAESGELNRTKLRDIIFADDNKREYLESILHPKIRQLIERQLSESSSVYTLLCVPLLIERGSSYPVGRILVVDCPEETQISRVMQRDDLTRSQVLAIMSNQASREERLSKADDVIINDGPLEELENQVTGLHEKYLALQIDS
ncbi:MAG: dephospho-CoA kinase [Pseudomonadota bacterium]